MRRRISRHLWSRRGMSPVVVLVGVPGSGKTTVGSLLSERLDVAFRDTDRDIERAEGRSIQDIFVDSGEPAFRALEKVAVARALEEHDGVLSLGSACPEVVVGRQRQQRVLGSRQALRVTTLAGGAEDTVGDWEVLQRGQLFD